MDKITLTRRFSYAASDTAGQLLFCFIQFYLFYFYTDVYGISAAAAGTILLVARLTDAIDAPVWGIIFEKTHSRWGKSRPWFLWLCVPFAIFGVLTFMTPNLGHTAKILYAGGTYIVCSILYTGINTPVTSILSALTPNPQERVTLTSFRMFGSKVGVLIVNLTALKIVTWLGGGDDRKGFMLTMPIFATGSVLLYLLAFWNLKEVVKVAQKSLPIKGAFGALKGNWPWIIIFSSSLCFWIAFLSRICTVPFFFTYCWHSEGFSPKTLIRLANSLDFVSLATILLLPFFCKWISKRNIWLVGLIGSVFAQLILYLGVHVYPSLSLILAGWIIGFLTSGMAMTLPFAMLSDSVDYGEWKTGIRAAGLLSAIGAAFCAKAGSGLGSALPAWIMDAHGYVPNVPQTASSQAGIELGFIWVPALFYALSAIPVIFYKKYELMEPQIHADLDQRRAQSSVRGESSPLATS
jgi:sugar (glycoside-pentoside-hexuronide) transporter